MCPKACSSKRGINSQLTCSWIKSSSVCSTERNKETAGLLHVFGSCGAWGKRVDAVRVVFVVKPLIIAIQKRQPMHQPPRSSTSLLDIYLMILFCDIIVPNRPGSSLLCGALRHSPSSLIIERLLGLSPGQHK